MAPVVTMRATADVKEVVDGLQRCEKAIDSFAKKAHSEMEKLQSTMGITALATSITAVEHAFHGVHAAIESVLGVFEKLKGFETGGALLGMGGDEMGKLLFAGRMNGLDEGTTKQGLTRLLKTISTGSGDNGLRLLGLDPESIKRSSTFDAIDTIREKFSSLDTAGQMRAAAELGLGRNIELLKVLSMEGDEFRRVGIEAEQSGYLGTASSREQAKEIVHVSHQIGLAWEGIKNSFLSSFGGVIGRILEAVRDLIKDVKTLWDLLMNPMVLGALAGARVGAAFGGIPGALIGAGLGAIAGPLLEGATNQGSGHAKESKPFASSNYFETERGLAQRERSLKQLEQLENEAWKYANAIKEADAATLGLNDAEIKRLRTAQEANRQREAEGILKSIDDRIKFFGMSSEQALIEKKLADGILNNAQAQAARLKAEELNMLEEQAKVLKEIERENENIAKAEEARLDKQAQDAWKIGESFMHPIDRAMMRMNEIASNPWLSADQVDQYTMQIARDALGNMVPNLTAGNQMVIAGTSAGESAAFRLQARDTQSDLLRTQAELLRDQLVIQRRIATASEKTAEAMNGIEEE